MLVLATLLAVSAPTVSYREDLSVLGTTSTSTSTCVALRCRHERGGFGVYPPVTLLVDGDALWAQVPDGSAAARLEQFRAYDRNWFVDVPNVSVTFAPASTAGRTPPPLANERTTLWVADVDGGSKLEVWVRPDLPQSAAQFADGLAARRPGFPIVAALRALPGRPIRVTQTFAGPHAPVATELTLTAMTESTSAPPSFAPSTGAERIQESALLPRLMAASTSSSSSFRAPANPTRDSPTDTDTDVIKSVETTARTTKTDPIPLGWRAFGAGRESESVDAVGLTPDSVILCRDDGCRVRSIATGEDRAIALPCPGAARSAAFAPQGRFIAVRCPYESDPRVFVVSVTGETARLVDVDADLGLVVSDRGLVRTLAQRGARVDVFDEQPSGRMVRFEIDYDASRAAPDLGHGALLFSTHQLAGPHEAAFFLEGDAVVRVAVTGGPLINGACLWISRMSGGYERVTPKGATPVADELRGATVGDGLLGAIRPWGDRGFVVNYERRAFLYDGQLRAGASFEKASSDEVYASPSGAFLVLVRGSATYVRDVSDAVARTPSCVSTIPN